MLFSTHKMRKAALITTLGFLSCFITSCSSLSQNGDSQPSDNTEKIHFLKYENMRNETKGLEQRRPPCQEILAVYILSSAITATQIPPPHNRQYTAEEPEFQPQINHYSAFVNEAENYVHSLNYVIFSLLGRGLSLSCEALDEIEGNYQIISNTIPEIKKLMTKMHSSVDIAYMQLISDDLEKLLQQMDTLLKTTKELHQSNRNLARKRKKPAVDTLA